MKDYIVIHPDDQVGVALRPLRSGTLVTVGETTIKLTQDIPQGHKFALTKLPQGTTVTKYGAPIGITTAAVAPGDWIHTHNLKTKLGELLTYEYHPNHTPIAPSDECYFAGFRRKNGKVGVRNEIWIIPTVGCVNSVVTALERQAQHLVSGSIDCIAAFPHPYGCSQMGDDQDNTRKILANLIQHPNAGAVLVVGLGCENSNIDTLMPYIGEYDTNRVKFLVCQDCEDELQEGMALLESLAAYASLFQREPVSCSELIIGMKCGGSDGLSGITANPTVGVFSDILISKGGTTILTEVPEMFGAETLLMERCENEKIFSDTVNLINNFKCYFTAHNQTIYENPSPGNKNGGITTLEDKSLGCTQKSGSAPVVGVLSYGETVQTPGLNLLSAPGNDLVASTALAASGAHIVLFTTGRGTPFASPVPTMKISSNTPLATNKHNWIDFDCGVVTEDISINELGQQLFDFVLEVASGQQLKSEVAGYHDMAIFKQGVTL